MEILPCHRNPTQFYVQRLYVNFFGMLIFFLGGTKTGYPWALELRHHKSVKHLIYERHMLQLLGLNTSRN
jgi:hypothetical protein